MKIPPVFFGFHNDFNDKNTLREIFETLNIDEIAGVPVALYFNNTQNAREDPRLEDVS
jgi:hypothetical protein